MDVGFLGNMAPGFPGLNSGASARRSPDSRIRPGRRFLPQVLARVLAPVLAQVLVRVFHAQKCPMQLLNGRAIASKICFCRN